MTRFWPRRRPGPLRVLALLAGLGLLLFIATRVDLVRVWEGVLALGLWGAVVVCAVYFLAFLVDTASWHLMLPSLRLVPSRLFRLWKVRMVGEALNSLVPAGSLGGEPVKAVLLKRNYGVGYHEGGASLIMAKTVNLLALIGFCALGLVILHRGQTLAAPVRLAAEAALVALGLGVGGFFAVQRWHAASRAAAWLARRHFGPRLARFLAHIQEVEVHFLGFYGARPGRFAAAFGLSWLNWLIGCAELWTILWFLDRPISWTQAWAIEAVAQLARATFFFIPAGLGAVEGGLVLVIGAMTGAPSLGLAVAVVRRARELLWNAWGLWLGWYFSLAPAAGDLRTEAGASGSVARDGNRR